jgi:hypothetical protein
MRSGAVRLYVLFVKPIAEAPRLDERLIAMLLDNTLGAGTIELGFQPIQHGDSHRSQPGSSFEILAAAWCILAVVGAFLIPTSTLKCPKRFSCTS